MKIYPSCRWHSGRVTGLRRGQATVTANVYSGQSLLCSATKTIQVVEDTTVSHDISDGLLFVRSDGKMQIQMIQETRVTHGTSELRKLNVTGATLDRGQELL